MEPGTKCHRKEMDNANQLILLGLIIKYLLPSQLQLFGVQMSSGKRGHLERQQVLRFSQPGSCPGSQAGAFLSLPGLVLSCSVWMIPSDSKSRSRGVAAVSGE